MRIKNKVSNNKKGQVCLDMVRDKNLSVQIDFLNQLLTAMDENNLSDQQMKYIDAYLVHLEKEQEQRKVQAKWEEEQKKAIMKNEIIEQVTVNCQLKRKEERKYNQLVETGDEDMSRRDKLERSVDRFVDFNKFDDDDSEGVEKINFQDHSDDESLVYEKYPVLNGGIYIKYSNYEHTHEHLQKNKTLLKV